MNSKIKGIIIKVYTKCVSSLFYSAVEIDCKLDDIKLVELIINVTVIYCPTPSN